MTTDDSSVLADSAFEIINTDGESLDEHGTESVCSLDSPRSDDVRSFRGRSLEDEPADSDSGEDSESSKRVSSIQYADEVLDTPSPRRSLDIGSSYGTLSQQDSNPSSTIEFEEIGSSSGAISVRHTIRDFGVEGTAAIAKTLGMSAPPKRLIATIRQTMSPYYMPARVPLRILYIGSDAAKRDIIYKVSSALMASASKSDSAASLGQGSETIYNIVPISAFGSATVPEVELMETSTFQIKVENCTSAVKDCHGSSQDPQNHVYSLSIDNERTYKSFVKPDGPVVIPSWEMPHLAIFYCTGTDDASTIETREAALGVMVRHHVPCLFISHEADLEKPLPGRWRGHLDPHTLHISIESGSPEHQIVPERVPVDLTSFLNIDARQMNRNLALITGLYQKSNVHKADVPHGKGSKPQNVWCQDKLLGDGSRQNIIYRSVLSVLLILAGCVIGNYLSQAVERGEVMSGSLSSVTPTSVMTSTVTVERTSTKTIEVPKIGESSAFWAPGLLWNDGYSSVTAKDLDTDIVIELPTEQPHWLTSGRVRATVRRGSDAVASRVSRPDPRVISVRISKDEAYGILIVDVENSNNPGYRHAVEVDFREHRGSVMLDEGVAYIHKLISAFVTAFNDTVAMSEHECLVNMDKVSGIFLDEAAVASSHFQHQFNLMRETAERYASHVTDMINRHVVLPGPHEYRRVLERIHPSSKIYDTAEVALRQAQISSKLWWLKLTGKDGEYEEYERHASKFMADKKVGLNSHSNLSNKEGHKAGDWSRIWFNRDWCQRFHRRTRAS